MKFVASTYEDSPVTRSFLLPFALQDATRLGVYWSILVKEASRVKGKIVSKTTLLGYPILPTSSFPSCVGPFLRCTSQPSRDQKATIPAKQQKGAPDNPLCERLNRESYHTGGLLVTGSIMSRSVHITELRVAPGIDRKGSTG